MRVTSKDLSSESKVIIYPGSRKFFANELPILREKLDSFCDDFKGVNLCCEIEYDRFLIFMISSLVGSYSSALSIQTIASLNPPKLAMIIPLFFNE